MTHELPPNAATSQPSLDDKGLDELRRKYRRVSGHGPTRITITTFLSPIALGAFAALIGAGPLTDLSAPDLGKLAAAWLVVLIDALFGGASILFLLTTMASFKAVQALSDVPAPAVDALTSAGPASGIPAPVVAELMALEPTLTDAYDIYDRSGLAIPVGIGCLLASLPLIGLHLHPVIGAISLGTLIAAASTLFRPYLRSFALDLRNKDNPPPGSILQVWRQAGEQAWRAMGSRRL